MSCKRKPKFSFVCVCGTVNDRSVLPSLHLLAVGVQRTTERKPCTELKVVWFKLLFIILGLNLKKGWTSITSYQEKMLAVLQKGTAGALLLWKIEGPEKQLARRFQVVTDLYHSHGPNRQSKCSIWMCSVRCLLWPRSAARCASPLLLDLLHVRLGKKKACNHAMDW